MMGYFGLICRLAHASRIPKILKVMAANGSLSPWFETDDECTSFVIRLQRHPLAQDPVMPIGEVTMEVTRSVHVVTYSNMIFADGTVTRVLDLHDWSKGDVSLIIDKHSYSLLPGNEVGIVKGFAKAEAARLAHKDQLGRRRMRILQVNADTQLVTGDFPVVDALNKFPLLAHLSKSTSAADRHLFSNIVKMAAVLSMTTDTTRGSYTREGQQ